MPLWAPKSTRLLLHRFTPDGLVFDLVVRWFQDGRQDRPRRLLGRGLGPSWGGLGPLLGALGPSLAGLGDLLGCLEVGALLAAFGRSWMVFWGRFGCCFGVRLVDSIHRSDFDSVIRFNDAIRRFDWLILFVASTH